MHLDSHTSEKEDCMRKQDLIKDVAQRTKQPESVVSGGEPIQIAAGKTPSFRPGTQLKRAVGGE